MTVWLCGKELMPAHTYDEACLASAKNPLSLLHGPVTVE